MLELIFVRNIDQENVKRPPIDIIIKNIKTKSSSQNLTITIQFAINSSIHMNQVVNLKRTYIIEKIATHGIIHMLRYKK